MCEVLQKWGEQEEREVLQETVIMQDEHSHEEGEQKDVNMQDRHSYEEGEQETVDVSTGATFAWVVLQTHVNDFSFRARWPLLLGGSVTVMPSQCDGVWCNYELLL